MQRLPLLALALCAIGCSTDSPTQTLRTAPPSPIVTGSTRVISASGALALEVTAMLTNPTSTAFKVNVGSQCPAVRIFPDPTGEPQLIGSPPPCASDRPVVGLAPGAAVTGVRLLPGDSYAGLEAGLYGVNIEIAVDSTRIGLWAGTVRLPLAVTP